MFLKKMNLKNQKGISIVEILVSLGILGIVFTSVLNYQDLFLKFDTQAEQKVQSKFSQGTLLVSFKSFLFNQDNFCKLIEDPKVNFGVEAIDMYIDQETLASAFPKTGDTGLGKYLNSNRWELASDCANFTETNLNNLKYCIKPTANNPVSKANLRNLRAQLGLQIVDISPKKTFEKLSSPEEKTDDDAKKDPKTIGFIMIAEFVYDDLDSKKQRAFEKQFKWANEIGSCKLSSGKTVYFSSVSSPKQAVYNNPNFFPTEDENLFTFFETRHTARGGELCATDDRSKPCLKHGKCPDGKTCAENEKRRIVRTDHDLLVASACVENTYRKDYQCAFSKNKTALEWNSVRLEGALKYSKLDANSIFVMPFLKLQASYVDSSKRNTAGYSYAVNNKSDADFIDNITDAEIDSKLIDYSLYTTCQGEGTCTAAKRKAQDSSNSYWLRMEKNTSHRADFRLNATPFCNTLCDPLKNPKNLPAEISLGLRIKGHSTYDSSQYSVYSDSNMGCTVCYMKNCRRVGLGTFGKLSEQPIEPLDENTFTCLPKYVKENHAGLNKTSLDVTKNPRLIDETRFLERKLASDPIDHSTNYIALKYKKVNKDEQGNRHGFSLSSEQNALTKKLCFQNGRYQAVDKTKSCDGLGLVKIEKDAFDTLLLQNPDYAGQNGAFKSSFSSSLPSTVRESQESSSACASDESNCSLKQNSSDTYVRTVDYYIFYNDLKRGIGFLPTMIDAPYLAYKSNSAKRGDIKLEIANKLNKLYEDVNVKAELPVKKIQIAPFESSAGNKGALYKQAIFTYVPPALYKEETHPSYSFSYNQHSLPVLTKAPSFPSSITRDSATQNKTTGLLIGKIGDRKVTIEAKIAQNTSFPFICKSESGFRLSTSQSTKLHDGFAKCKSHSNHFFIHPTSAREWSEVFDLMGKNKFAWVNLERKVIKFPDVAEVQDFWSKAFSDDFLNLSAVLDGNSSVINIQARENKNKFFFKVTKIGDGSGSNFYRGFTTHSDFLIHNDTSVHSHELPTGIRAIFDSTAPSSGNLIHMVGSQSFLNNVDKVKIRKIGDINWADLNTGNIATSPVPGRGTYLNLVPSDFSLELGKVYEVEIVKKDDNKSYFINENKFVFKAANIHKDGAAGYTGFINGDQNTRVHNYRKKSSTHLHGIPSDFLGMFTWNGHFYYYSNSKNSRDNIEQIKVRKLGDASWKTYNTFYLDGNTSGTRWWKGSLAYYPFEPEQAYEVEIVKKTGSQGYHYLTRVKDLLLQYQSKKYKNEINVAEGSNTLERYYLKCNKNNYDPAKSSYQNQAYFLMANETVSRDVKKAIAWSEEIPLADFIGFGSDGRINGINVYSGLSYTGQFYRNTQNNPISFLGNGNIKGGFTSPLEVLLSPYIQEERIIASKKPFSYSGTLSHAGTGTLASKYFRKSCSN